MASKRAVSQFGFLAQRRPEMCLRIQSQRAVPGYCRCKHKSIVKFKTAREKFPPNVKKKMSMSEKIMRKTSYNLENSITPMLNDDELKHIYSSDLFVFRCDITTGTQVESAMGLYNQTLCEVGILSPNDISNLARALHYEYRRTRDKPAALAHVRKLIQDLRAKKVPGHPLASVHIVSCLKEMREYEDVNELWGWLQDQKEEHLDSRVVGAVIEVLALQGEDLPRLEHMFRQALQDYSIHMDQGGSLNHRATRIILLQGIITARLLNGEWRRAYDGLDICLQLHPTWTPSRLFELFIFHRPVLEGYIIFLMACRAGKALSQRVTTHMMKTWIDETRDVPGLLRMLYSYVGAGGKPTYEHMNIIISALLRFVPNYRLLRGTSEEEMQKINQHSQDVLAFVKSLVSGFQEAGVEPDRATYNTILNEGGKLANIHLITATLETMVQAKLPPDLITHRILLVAFGQLKQHSQVQASWEALHRMRLQMIKENEEELRAEAAAKPKFDPKERNMRATMPKWELKDWKALAKGCVYAGTPEYLEAQLMRLGHEIPPLLRDEVRKYARNIAKEIAEPEEQPDSFRAAPSIDKMLALHGALATAKVDFGRFRAIIKSPSAHDFTTTPIDFSDLPGMDPSAFALTMPDEDLQEVYRRFTKSRSSPFLSNWYKPGADYQDPGAYVSTGLTVGQLRFENWMSINKLLFIGEVAEVEKVNAVRGTLSPDNEGEAPEDGDRKPQKRKQANAKRAFGSEFGIQNLHTRRKKLDSMLKGVEKKMKSDVDAWDEIGVFRSALVGGSMEDPIKSVEGQDYLKMKREQEEKQEGKEV